MMSTGSRMIQWMLRIHTRKPFLAPFITNVHPMSPLQTSAFYLKKRNLDDKPRKRYQRPQSVTAEVMDADRPAVDVRDPIYRNRVTELLTYFPKKDIEDLAACSPEIFLQPWNEIAKKINYVIFRMKLDQPQIIEAQVLSFPLEHIVKRHIFLERCGVYKENNPRKNVVNLNPSTTSIIRSGNGNFVKLAGVSVEEYAIFSDMFEREKNKLIGSILDEEMIDPSTKEDGVDSDEDEDTENTLNEDQQAISLH